MNKELPIKSWRWIFYILGWIFGALNLVFWAWQYLMYMGDEKSDKFISNQFHKRVYYWGVLFTAIILITIIFVLID
ncbi:MAG: hypothetical protein ABH811_01570 [archaeon]